MAKYIKRIFIPIFIIAFMQILSFLYAGYNNRITSKQTLRIKLRPLNLIVGNQIVLGDICDINIQNLEIRKRFSNINIGLAPPPGESIEISLISIKKKIASAGFPKYIAYVIGPKTIRAETAHREIDKAFLREEFAQIKTNVLIRANKV